MIAALLKFLTGPFFETLSAFLNKRAERSERREDAKLETELARAKAEAEVYQKSATAEIDWGLVMAQNSGKSWKDEWILVLWSLPALMAFVPGMQGYVREGFQVLATDTPDWYIAAWGVIVAASYGFPRIVDAFKKSPKK